MTFLRVDPKKKKTFHTKLLDSSDSVDTGITVHRVGQNSATNRTLPLSRKMDKIKHTEDVISY